MIRSMTGFAAVTAQNDEYRIEASLRSVNSRYSEVSLKLPEQLRAYDPEIRNKFKDFFARGKFDLTVSVASVPGGPGDGAGAVLNEALLGTLLAGADEVVGRFKALDRHACAVTFSPERFLFYPGVLQEKKPEENAAPDAAAEARLKELAFGAIDGCMVKLSEARELEGAKILVFLTDHLDAIEALRNKIFANMPAIVEWQKKKVADFLAAHQVKADESLLEQEIVLLAQRMDIAEELNRLSSHIAQTRHILEKGGVCGKRLDFMMQEFNRETNTVASKSISTAITADAVELKVQIEQMREQIQNIE